MLIRAQKRDREWAKRLFARDEARIEEHEARMKWWEAFMCDERKWRVTSKKRCKKGDVESQKRHEESLARLDRIIDKLSNRQN